MNITENFDSMVLDALNMLNEKQRRLYLGEIAIKLGRGGITYLHKLTGASMGMIRRGIKDFKNNETYTPGSRIRRKGGGNKKLTEKYPDLKNNIEKIIERSSYGDPEKEICWTTESFRSIAQKIDDQYGITISYRSVGSILKEIGFSKQINQKKIQVGEPYPYRDEQFEFINDKNQSFMDKNLPVISVDTKKKEIIGNFKNDGAEYRRKGDPREVSDHDFPDGQLKISPYGIYDIKKNHGFVNVGISHDTAEFAVKSIEKWWNTEGKKEYPHANCILINADSGGSNGYRSRGWKYYLSEFANKEGIDIVVCHLPPGTSKWNKVEHRLFAPVSLNWNGKPLSTVDCAVNYIQSTTTRTGLTVTCVADMDEYKTGVKISNKQFNNIWLERNIFCGELNYTVRHKIS